MELLKYIKAYKSFKSFADKRTKHIKQGVKKLLDSNLASQYEYDSVNTRINFGYKSKFYEWDNYKFGILIKEKIGYGTAISFYSVDEYLNKINNFNGQ